MPSRRDFIKRTGAAAIGLYGRARESGFAIVSDPADAVARDPAVSWAAGELRGALETRRWLASDAGSGAARIFVAGKSSDRARWILEAQRVSLPDTPESVALIRRDEDLLVSGSDARGVVYGLLELADRVTYGPDAAVALGTLQRLVQQPVNSIRCVSR